MFVSIIIAQTAGFFLFLSAILMLLCSARFKQVIIQIISNDVALLLSNFTSLLFACFLLVIHSIFSSFPEVVISLLGYILFIKSILWLVIPAKMAILTKKCLAEPTYTLFALLNMIVGIFYLSCGFGFIWISQSNIL